MRRGRSISRHSRLLQPTQSSEARRRATRAEHPRAFGDPAPAGRGRRPPMPWVPGGSGGQSHNVVARRNTYARKETLTPPSERETAFGRSLRSVLSRGIIPQSEMARRRVAFVHGDDRVNQRSNVDVTRVVPSEDTATARQRAAERAMTADFHGVLPITIERAPPLRFDQESRRSAEARLRREGRLEGIPEHFAEAAVNYARTISLPPASRRAAETRMQSSFLVAARAGARPGDLAYARERRIEVSEQTRPRIAPRDMQAVVVPSRHLREALRVRAETGSMATVHGVRSTRALTFNVPGSTPEGREKIRTRGLAAPDYHTATQRLLRREGPLDLHVVRTPAPGRHGR